MSKITISCNKCQATATVASVKAIKDWSDLHECEHNGTILGRIVSPDCRDQNHQKCPGDAWDEAHDHGTECQCSCHIKIKATPPVLQVAVTAYKMHLNTGELTTLEGALAAALKAALPIFRAEARDALDRVLLDVEGTHHLHGTECTCSFKSERARSRTEHITGQIRAAFAEGMI